VPVVVEEGLQLVTVVVPGSIGAGVGQIIMHWMPVVTDVKEHPALIVSGVLYVDRTESTDLCSR
jgi:hypothetical protein